MSWVPEEGRHLLLSRYNSLQQAQEAILLFEEKYLHLTDPGSGASRLFKLSTRWPEKSIETFLLQIGKDGEDPLAPVEHALKQENLTRDHMRVLLEFLLSGAKGEAASSRYRPSYTQTFEYVIELLVRMWIHPRADAELQLSIVTNSSIIERMFWMQSGIFLTTYRAKLEERATDKTMVENAFLMHGLL